MQSLPLARAIILAARRGAWGIAGVAMHEQKWIVAITGAPATGTSALAALLRSRCGWPLLTKDGIKETLF